MTFKVNKLIDVESEKVSISLSTFREMSKEFVRINTNDSENFFFSIELLDDIIEGLILFRDKLKEKNE